MRAHIMTGVNYEAIIVELHTGGKLEYLALDSWLEVAWVPEADDALHFCRRSDAASILADAPDNWDIKITDHCWPGGTPRDRVVPQAEYEGAAPPTETGEAEGEGEK